MTNDPLAPLRGLLETLKTADTATPFGALLEHAAAFSSKDDRRFAESLSLPFMHVWPDGEIVEYKEPPDVDSLAQLAEASAGVAIFGQTELEAATLVLDWSDLKAFRARLARYSPQGQYLGAAEGIFVVVREGASWKVKLSIGAVTVNLA